MGDAMGAVTAVRPYQLLEATPSGGDGVCDTADDLKMFFKFKTLGDGACDMLIQIGQNVSGHPGCE